MRLSDTHAMTDAELIHEISNLIYNGTFEVTGPERDNHEVQGFTIPLHTMRSLRDLLDELEWRHVIKPTHTQRVAPPAPLGSGPAA